jgi:predicted DCC family thiol-disulfide oxidoreductase YuxK
MRQNKGPHLVFFDNECDLCNSSIHVILRLDKGRRFLFAPLNGLTAKEWLTGGRAFLKSENTLVLIENYLSPEPRTWIRGRAVFRILWLVGGFWKLLGWLCFTSGGDNVYRWIAHHRKNLGNKKSEPLPKDNRFLP